MRNFDKIENDRPLKLASFLQKLDQQLSIALFLSAALGSIPIILFSVSPQFNINHYLLCLTPIFVGFILMPVSTVVRRELKAHEERIAWQAKHRIF